MKEFIVKGKVIPLAGATNLIVQGEVSPEELRFRFNTSGEHQHLSTSVEWKLTYKRRDGQGATVALTKIDNGDGTWSLSWTPDNHVTYLNGQFVFLIEAYQTTVLTTTPLWKTTACPISIAKGITPSENPVIAEIKAWVNEQKGVANGLASLDENGKVPESQIPGGTGGTITDVTDDGTSIVDGTVAKITGHEKTANRVEAWQTTPDNSHYPTEKLVKDSLDLIKFKISVDSDTLKIEAPASYVTGDTLYIGGLA